MKFYSNQIPMAFSLCVRQLWMNQVNLATPPREVTYLPVIRKDSVTPIHVLAILLKGGFVLHITFPLKTLTIICFRMTSHLSAFFFLFLLYRSLSSSLFTIANVA